MKLSYSLVVFFVFMSIGVIAGLLLFSSLDTTTPRFISFDIRQGESFKEVSTRLKSLQLVRSDSVFYYLGRFTGKSGDIKAGEYELNTTMTAWEILKIVTGSHARLYKVTIPEGSNMFQIAKILYDQKLVDQVQFLEACWDRTFVESLHIPSFTVEGYLHPETYFIPRGSHPRSIIRMMVDMFWSRIDASILKPSGGTSPLSLHDRVIMASMIEKETGLVGEMSLISSVMVNRLKQNMKIQSDPTALYDLNPYSNAVKREHLFRKTPFNTYATTGLPLTPIGNPGILAIHAATYPESTEYIFFVSKRDGSHYFSKTYEEHQNAIQKFLKSE